MKRIIQIIFILLVVALCSSSCASWHLKRAKRLRPEWFSDTITTVRIDTVFIKTAPVITRIPLLPDTAITSLITDDRGQEVKIKYLWRTETDTIEIEAQCPPAEIIEKEVIKELPPIVLPPSLWDHFKWVAVGVGSGVFLLLLFKQVRS